MDVDFLVHRDDLASLHRMLTTLGYGRRALSENASHYFHPDPGWGSVDCLHAFRSYSLEMLERSRSCPVFGGTMQIKVLQPEDVIGFKIQAMVNNPSRIAREALDIEALMSHYRSGLEWDRIQQFYDLFERSEEGRQLRKRFDHAQ